MPEVFTVITELTVDDMITITVANIYTRKQFENLDSKVKRKDGSLYKLTNLKTGEKTKGLWNTAVNSSKEKGAGGSGSAPEGVTKVKERSELFPGKVDLKAQGFSQTASGSVKPQNQNLNNALSHSQYSLEGEYEGFNEPDVLETTITVKDGEQVGEPILPETDSSDTYNRTGRSL